MIKIGGLAVIVLQKLQLRRQKPLHQAKAKA
jgi:hypothetical protein